MFSLLPLLRRGALAALLTCGSLAAPGPASAAPPPGPAPVLVGFSLYEVVGNRTRLIQASVIMVTIGISLLWIGKK